MKNKLKKNFVRIFFEINEDECPNNTYSLIDFPEIEFGLIIDSWTLTLERWIQTDSGINENTAVFAQEGADEPIRTYSVVGVSTNDGCLCSASIGFQN